MYQINVSCDWRCAVAEWYSAGLATARSWVQIPPVAAVYQRQLSVPSLQGQLMSTSESWGVNGHTTQCTSPVSVVMRIRLVSGWGLFNGDPRRPMGSWGSGKDFTFLWLKVWDGIWWDVLLLQVLMLVRWWMSIYSRRVLPKFILLVSIISLCFRHPLWDVGHIRFYL